MDYNWFLSATAQSTAAIVGIFSAFIITKIINNQKIYKNNLDLFVKLENESDKLKRLNNIDKHMHLGNENTVGPPDSIIIEKAKIEVEIISHIKKINHSITRVSQNSESSILISFSIISLLILFFVGVIVPLCKLPSSPDAEIRLLNFIMSFKNFQIILLLIISIIFTTIMIIFFRENIKMKYDKKEIEKIKKYANIDYY